MQYFKITGVDHDSNLINHKHIIDPEDGYEGSLHFAIADALNNQKICWRDFAEGLSPDFFNHLIESGETKCEIHGWVGKFTVELFNDEQDEYFSNLFKEHPQPWQFKYNIGECGNGGAIHGVVDANNECIISTYMGSTAAEAMWKLYQYYVSKQGKTL